MLPLMDTAKRAVFVADACALLGIHRQILILLVFVLSFRFVGHQYERDNIQLASREFSIKLHLCAAVQLIEKCT